MSRCILRGDGGTGDDPLVRIASGRVKGFKDQPDAWVWRGIPYAAPPVGELRWKAPRKVEPWRGIKPARSFGAPCMQYNPLSPRILGSEDCLYLNIWRPRTDETGLPVMVWIHGGGNSTGSANYQPEYYGNQFASKGNAVVVSINYRLGPFGWFTHPQLREQETGNPLDNSGNYGTLDIIQSLHWIRENIGAFGGDPLNVTVAGESAGAINILSLMISPLAEGLFHKAIIRSGGFMLNAVSKGDADSQAVIETLLQRDYKKEIPGDQIEYLRGKAPEEILKAYEPSIFGMTGAAAVFRDGEVIPLAGSELLFTRESFNRVPVMIGSNKDETKIFLNWDPRFRRRDDLYQAITSFGTDMWRAYGVDKVARAMTKAPNPPPVYSYLFSWGTLDEKGESPLPGKSGRRLGAFHSIEIPYFMGNLEKSRLFNLFFLRKDNRQGAFALQEAVITYVGSFLSTGNPNTPNSSLPQWEAWTNEADGPKTLILDADKETLNIRMSNEEYTPEMIHQQLKERASPALYADVMGYMEENPIWLE